MREIKYRGRVWKEGREGSWFSERGDYVLRVERVRNGYWYRLYYMGQPIVPEREPCEKSLYDAINSCHNAHVSHYIYLDS